MEDPEEQNKKNGRFWSVERGIWSDNVDAETYYDARRFYTSYEDANHYFMSLSPSKQGERIYLEYCDKEQACILAYKY